MALKKKTMKSYLPFAPFLSFGAVTVMLFGDIIIKGYLSLLLIG
jgi:prepilin signal peptidase PulO-like enzyme (type II secretory pathway)